VSERPSQFTTVLSLYSVVNWTLKSLHIIDHDIPWL